MVVVQTFSSVGVLLQYKLPATTEMRRFRIFNRAWMTHFWRRFSRTRTRTFHQFAGAPSISMLNDLPKTFFSFALRNFGVNDGAN